MLKVRWYDISNIIKSILLITNDIHVQVENGACFVSYIFINTFSEKSVCICNKGTGDKVNYVL